MGTSTVCSRGSWPVTSLWPFYKPEPSQRERKREREICPIVPITVLRRGMRVCPCVCARVSPHPPLQTSPPSPPSLSLSHPLSCAHSLIPSRAEKAGRAAPRSETPVLKLTHAAGRPVDTLRATGLGRRGVMEMVHQAIYSLPQYGFSDLLSSHQGNKRTETYATVSFLFRVLAANFILKFWKTIMMYWRNRLSGNDVSTLDSSAVKLFFFFSQLDLLNTLHIFIQTKKGSVLRRRLASLSSHFLICCRHLWCVDFWEDYH